MRCKWKNLTTTSSLFAAAALLCHSASSAQPNAWSSTSADTYVQWSDYQLVELPSNACPLSSTSPVESAPKCAEWLDSGTGEVHTIVVYITSAGYSGDQEVNFLDLTRTTNGSVTAHTILTRDTAETYFPNIPDWLAFSQFELFNAADGSLYLAIGYSTQEANTAKGISIYRYTGGETWTLERRILDDNVSVLSFCRHPDREGLGFDTFGTPGFVICSDGTTTGYSLFVPELSLSACGDPDPKILRIDGNASTTPVDVDANEIDGSPIVRTNAYATTSPNAHRDSWTAFYDATASTVVLAYQDDQGATTVLKKLTGSGAGTVNTIHTFSNTGYAIVRGGYGSSTNRGVFFSVDTSPDEFRFYNLGTGTSSVVYLGGTQTESANDVPYADPALSLFTSGLSFLPGGRPLLWLLPYSGVSLNLSSPASLIASSPAIHGSQKSIVNATASVNQFDPDKLSGIPSIGDLNLLTAKSSVALRPYPVYNPVTKGTVGLTYHEHPSNGKRYVMTHRVRGATSGSDSETLYDPLSVSSGTTFDAAYLGRPFPIDSEGVYKLAVSIAGDADPTDPSELRIRVNDKQNRMSSYVSYPAYDQNDNGSSTINFLFAAPAGINSVDAYADLIYGGASDSVTINSMTLTRETTLGVTQEYDDVYEWEFPSSELWFGSGAYNSAEDWIVPYYISSSDHDGYYYFGASAYPNVLNGASTGNGFSMGIDHWGYCFAKSPNLTLTAGRLYRIGMKYLLSGSPGTAETTSTSPEIRARLFPTGALVGIPITLYSGQTPQVGSGGSVSSGFCFKSFYAYVPDNAGSAFNLFIDLVDPIYDTTTSQVEWTIELDAVKIDQLVN